MSMLDGVSQCWLLSRTCKVDWEAWSAIGTVAAVFTAILAPTIQRWLVRKRANALYFFAHNSDVAAVNHYLGSLEELFEEQAESPFRTPFLIELRSSYQKRVQFRAEVVGGVAPLAERVVDLEKWPGIDHANAALLAVAIGGCKALSAGATNLVDYKDEADFEKRIRGLRSALTVARLSVAKALRECNLAATQLFKEHVQLY